MIRQWRKSATWPSASVSRPSSNTCRNRSQMRGWAFSNSSKRTTENGCLRTRLIRGFGLVVGDAVAEDLGHRFRGLELAHVEAQQALDRAEQIFGGGLGELGLAGAGRSGEQEHPDRPARIAQPASSMAMRSTMPPPPRADRSPGWRRTAGLPRARPARRCRARDRQAGELRQRVDHVVGREGGGRPCALVRRQRAEAGALSPASPEPLR